MTCGGRESSTARLSTAGAGCPGSRWKSQSGRCSKVGRSKKKVKRRKQRKKSDDDDDKKRSSRRKLEKITGWGGPLTEEEIGIRR